MLRNATRELERRRRMPRLVFHGPLILSRLLSQGCSRQSQVAVATRHHDAGELEHREAVADEPSSRRGKAVTIVKLGRHMPLSPQGVRGGLPNDRTLCRHDVQHATRALDRRQHELETARVDRGDIFANQDISREPVAVDDPPKGPRWLGNRRCSRPVERSAELSKSWGKHTPNLLLQRVLESRDDLHHWKRRAAMARSIRLPIILLQMLIHKQGSQLPGREALLDLLPNTQEWDTAMAIVRGNGHTLDDLDHYLYILEGKTDDVRCERFLERDSYKPIFILNFLLRRSSTFTKVETLSSIIEYCRNLSTNASRYDKEGTKPRQTTPSQPKWTVSPVDFNLTMGLLARHCLRLEPRLILRLAEVAVQYIEAISSCHIPEKAYQTRCSVFNNTLQLFQPQPRMQAVQRSAPNAFFWEAQRTLLAMSARLEQPLLVDRDGFRAIRNVLASLPKNQTEIHSSVRHAETWPPYLQPGDGMDEATDPEDNWSRAVRAGMLMQEAGFSKEERDDALDILQGMAPDGTPTIQQRTSLAKKRNLCTWEASIRATRNAQEAWQRFRNPPKPDLKPGSRHYAAMFEKLVLPEADTNSRALPGDKALNFPIQQEANLAEFEIARLRPPSVAQLYQQMRLDGIPPKDRCLQILVANAGSLDTAHCYLHHSTEDTQVIRALISDDADAESLKGVNMGLFSAYIQVLTRQENKRTARHMMRAIRMTGSRVELERSPLVQFVWGSILKNLSQNHFALRISLDEQLKLFFHVIERIDGHHAVPLSAFVQFSKCVRKAARGELGRLPADLTLDDLAAERNPLLFLYDQQSRDREEIQQSSTGQGPENRSPLFVLSTGAARMKELFHMLTSQEKESQRLLGVHQVAALDRMVWRKDPVRSEHAYEYMLSLAYVGEFQEMANVLKWLVEEWGQPDVVEALSEFDEPPPYADFLDSLCAFRLFAEPMLEQGVVESLQEAIGVAKLAWAWPDDEAVEAYTEMQDDESITSLAHVLERIRQDEQRRQVVESEQA